MARELSTTDFANPILQGPPAPLHMICRAAIGVHDLASIVIDELMPKVKVCPALLLLELLDSFDSAEPAVTYNDRTFRNVEGIKTSKYFFPTPWLAIESVHRMFENSEMKGTRNFWHTAPQTQT